MKKILSILSISLIQSASSGILTDALLLRLNRYTLTSLGRILFVLKRKYATTNKIFRHQ